MIPARRLFILVYGASGAAALVYEVAWTRMLALQLGHTVAATSTVLAAFMGGLASGAWLAGRRTPSSPRNSLRAYALLEITVAVCAALLPTALGATTPLLARAYADGSAPATFAVVRVAISIAILAVPAAAMGATFPIATDWFADAGLLYAANTAGAALGAVAAGFWLIPALGLRATTAVGIALNLTAAAGAWWISTKAIRLRSPADSASSGVTSRAQRDAKQPARVRALPRRSSPSSLSEGGSPQLAWIAVGISGFTALVYEVAWTRLLALVIGPTTYAFATMAAAFIGGLAIGSAAGTAAGRRSRRPVLWLSALLMVSAVTAAPSAWYAASQMPLGIAAQVAAPGVVFGRVVAAQAIEVGLLLLPTTFALGATFPLALAVASSASRAARASTTGRDASRVYAANTLGAIGGALVGGFVLIPLLGLRGTFNAAAIAGAVTGIACLARSSRRAAIAGIVVAAIAFVTIVQLPPWDPGLLSSGAYKYAPYLFFQGTADLDQILRAGTLEYYKEGAAATVSVRELTGTRSLAIDGKIDASNASDMLTQRLLGLLPVLIHGRARTMCVIGLGSGVTSGSALVPGAPGGHIRLDVVEISPEVVAASHFFDRENGGVLARPDVRLIVGDGRSHLLLTTQRYDVIVSEPSNPWMAGVATLFTREFFQAARARLEPDGLLCQWAHTYDISADDLRSIVRTFGSVFPDGTMWLVGEGDLLLIGSNGGSVAARLDAAAARARDPGVAAMLATVGMTDGRAPFDLLSLFVGGPLDLARYGGDARIQTDDHTPLEYTAPLAIYAPSSGENAAALRALGRDVPPAVAAALKNAAAADWVSRGRMELQAEAFAIAYDAFDRAVESDRRSEEALSGLSESAAGAGRQAEERALLEKLAAGDALSAPVRIELSKVLADAGELESAVSTATEAVRLAPENPRAAEQLASILADAGDLERLEPLVGALASRFPGRMDGQYYWATALFQRGRVEDAASAAQRVVAANPRDGRAQNLLGAACGRLGRRECARSAFNASIDANPRNPSTYVNFGVFSLEAGDPQSAARYFSVALTIDPRSSAARSGLAQARALLENPR